MITVYTHENNVSWNEHGNDYYTEEALYYSDRLGEDWPKDMIDEMLDKERDYVLNDLD